MERERGLQAKYAQLQEQMRELQEAHLQVQQYQQMENPQQGSQLNDMPEQYVENGQAEGIINQSVQDQTEHSIENV